MDSRALQHASSVIYAHSGEIEVYGAGIGSRGYVAHKKQQPTGRPIGCAFQTMATRTAV